jgi:hypothetical protein
MMPPVVCRTQALNATVVIFVACSRAAASST